MASETTLRRLQQLLSQIPDVLLHPDDILPTHCLRENLGLDSLAMIEVLVSVEDEFHFEFDPLERDLDKVFETVESLAEFIDQQIDNA